jgi:hypothetical protein
LCIFTSAAYGRHAAKRLFLQEKATFFDAPKAAAQVKMIQNSIGGRRGQWDGR